MVMIHDYVLSEFIFMSSNKTNMQDGSKEKNVYISNGLYFKPNGVTMVYFGEIIMNNPINANKIQKKQE